MAGEINGKVIFITGGSKGIGYGIAETLVREGAKVAITSRSAEAAEKAAKELNKISTGSALGLGCDVRKLKDQESAVAAAVRHFGKMDVLVANAGIGHFANVENITEEQWNETIDTNLSGVFFSVKAALAELKKTKGYIITIASLAGTNFFANGSAYNASKFGLVGFTQAIMLDLRQHGIKACTIMPGSVATYFNGHTPSPADEWKIQPEDIGQMVSDLLKLNPRTLPSKIEVRPSMPK